MSDPIYIFEKGKGWVLETCSWAETKDISGKPVRIELRKPNNGEEFAYTSSPWDLNRWLDWTQNSYRCNQRHKYPVGKPRDSYPVKSWCVFIPL